jgi:osmotically-inducible protein OsmY
MSSSSNRSGYPASAPAPDTRDRDFAINSNITKHLSERGLRAVRVRTEYGQVVLSGCVETEQERVLAEQIATGEANVIGVKNTIVVSADPNINKRAGPKAKCLDTP